MLLDEFKESYKNFMNYDGVRRLCEIVERSLEWHLTGDPYSTEEEIKQRQERMAPSKRVIFSSLVSGVLFTITCKFSFEDKNVTFISLTATPESKR